MKLMSGMSQIAGRGPRNGMLRGGVVTDRLRTHTTS
jgi:hypothetical protein